MDRASRVAPSRVGVDVPCRALPPRARGSHSTGPRPARGSSHILFYIVNDAMIDRCYSNDAKIHEKFKPRGAQRGHAMRAPELEPNAQT